MSGKLIVEVYSINKTNNNSDIKKMLSKLKNQRISDVIILDATLVVAYFNF